MPSWFSTSRHATTLRSPIWIEPGGLSEAKRLAPPTSRAVIRRRSAPSSIISSSSVGTAVCGVLPGRSGRRARVWEGNMMCAIPATRLKSSYRRMATQLPRP
jgi:hypothetical protein